MIGVEQWTGTTNGGPDRTIRVLLVDDDAAYATIARRLLRASTWARFEVDVVTTYEAAVARDVGRFDLVLLDYDLDRHTGFDVLRHWHARAEHTPVIMLTAAGGDSVDLDAMAAGAADYFDKADLEAKALERAIRYALASHRTIRSLHEMMRWQYALARAARRLLEVTDRDALTAQVVRIAVEELGATAASFDERQADGGLETIAVSGPSTAVQGAPICFPLETQDGPIGALNVWSAEGGSLSPTMVEVFATHAGVAALALRGMRLQEQLRHSQKLEAVGQLAAGVAHDFNNLLTAILGNASLLLEVPLDQASRECAEEIVAAGDRAASLTRQLLAFGRRQMMTPEMLDPNGVIARVQPLLRRLIPEHIAIELDLNADGAAFRADRGQIEQVVMNLAVNARDAMPHGGTLQISTRWVRIDERIVAQEGTIDPGPYVVLAVSDTGQGIEPSVRPRIFEPFFTSKPPGKGTGLGLPTVLGIVQQSGGRLTVESQPGLGATFRMYFPAVSDPSGAGNVPAVH